MSVQATNFVRRLRGLDITEKAVAMILADHDSYKGLGSFPAMSTLAAESGIRNRQTASDVVRRLLSKGVITTEKVSRGGRGKTTVYRFNYSLINCNSGVTVFADNCNSPIAVLTDSNAETATPESINCKSEGPKLQPKDPETATGELHEGFKEFEGKREERERENEKLSLTHDSIKANGQEKVLANLIVRIAKQAKPQAAFTQKAKNQLESQLSEIVPPPTDAELDQAVTAQVSGMDDFALRTAGSTIGAGLVGAIQAIRFNAKAKQDALDNKRKVADSHRKVSDWRIMLNKAHDIDQFLEASPAPAWFIEGQDKPMGYAEDDIKDAREALARRNQQQHDAMTF
jgi:hypothetical protein